MPPVALLAPAAVLLVAAALPGNATAAGDPVADTRFDRLPGEYDNHEQLWQAELDAAAAPPRRHLRIARTAAPKLGPVVLAIDGLAGDGRTSDGLNSDRRTSDASATGTRLVLILRPTAASPPAGDPAGSVPATLYAAPAERVPDPQADPAAFARLRPRDLRGGYRCELAFDLGRDGALEGRLAAGGCTSRRGGGAAPPTWWRHDGETLWVAEALASPAATRRAAIPAGALRLRRAQHYTGWAAVKPDGPASTGGDDSYRFMSGLTVHNEGQVVPILDPDGRATGYSFQLARLTYQNTRTPILKLGLIDDATGETLVYSWAEPGAERIGINVRWAQVGLTRKPGVPSFAVDPPGLPTGPPTGP